MAGPPAAHDMATTGRGTATHARHHPQGIQVLRKVTGHSRLAETFGLRSARKHPASDSLVEREDGRLFLGPVALRRLRGKVLDAHGDADGRIEFVLRSASAARCAGENTSARASP